MTPEQAYTTLREKALNFLRKRGARDPEDRLHDAMVKLLRYDDVNTSLVYKACLDLVCNEYHKTKNDLPYFDEHARKEDIEQNLICREQVNCIVNHRAIKNRDILIAISSGLGHSPDEIAAEMGTTPEMVRTRLCRVRKELKRRGYGE